MSGAVWLYAVVPAGGPAAGDVGVTGVAGEPVRLVTEGGLAAVVGSVPLSDFAAGPLKEHLEDLRWLEGAARAHHGVIETLSRSATADVLPLRFATVYHDDDAVRGALRERAADFAAALDRTAGRAEWGVKGYVDPDAGPEPAPAGPGGDARRPGTAYLLRRRAERYREEETYRLAQDWAAGIRDALADVAAGGAPHPPQDPRLAGYRGWMILNDSFLVDRGRAEDFTSAVGDCGRRFPAVRLELSGPWPPYSFVGATASGDRPEEEEQQQQEQERRQGAGHS